MISLGQKTTKDVECIWCLSCAKQVIELLTLSSKLAS